jgi:hypothetical protein
MPDANANALSPADVAREVQRLAELLYPGWVTHVALVVHHPDGRPTVIRGRPDAAPARLTERQAEILQVFEENPAGTVLTGPQLARLVGCEYDGHFRADLSALKKARRLAGHNPGYSLVP